MALNNLNLASNAHIIVALTNLRTTYNANNAWLTGNRYLNNTIGTIRSDLSLNTVNHSELTNYIATSAHIHCFNAWSYLSTAINSYLDGDFSNSIHNAYYAELRSTMSYLALNGIGVFNGSNVIVKSDGTILPSSPLPTHKFVKQAFDEWLNFPNNKEIVLEIIKVENKSLKDWLDATGFFGSSNLPNFLASDWLKKWSLDLSILNNESDFRNFVSYNPQTFNLNLGRHSDSIINRLNFVSELWKLCAPSDLFSITLLRNSLRDLYISLFQIDISTFELERDWNSIFTELGINASGAKGNYLVKFFRRELEPNDNLVFHYAKNCIASNPILETDTDPIGIISRACLLLLINTKYIESILLQTSTSKLDLKFWFDNIGLKSGYWDATSEPYLYSDLWDDIDLELNEIKNWLNDTTIGHSNYTFKGCSKSFGTNFLNLNKSYLWNLAK